MAPGSSPLRRPFFSNLDFNVAGCFFLFPFFLSLYSLPPFLFSFFLLSERDTLCRRYVKDTRIQSDAIFFLPPPSSSSFAPFVNRIDVFIERIVMVRSKITMIGIHRANWTIWFFFFFLFSETLLSRDQLPLQLLVVDYPWLDNFLENVLRVQVYFEKKRRERERR